MTQRTDFEKKKETPWYGQLHLKRLVSSLFSPDPVQLSSESPFNLLVNDMIKEIARRLPAQQPLQDKGFLSNILSTKKKLSPLGELISVSKQFQFLLQPDYLLNKFLQSVVDGNQKKAETFLTTYPQFFSLLLQQKSQVTDYSGRTHFGTALGMALGAEDVKYHDDEECMAEMLMRYLKKLPNSETIIDKQIADQFPVGWEAKEKERAERDTAALNKVVAALENAPANDNCAVAINAFKQYLEDENKNRGVIETGKHFNMQLLIDALNLYVQKFNQFGGSWDSPKNILFWRKIIGKIERYAPTCYAQATCQDVYQIVECDEKLERRLTFRYDPAVTYYPLDTDPKFILGGNYAAARAAWRGRARGAASLFTLALSNYVKQKKSAQGRLCDRSQTISQRVIMS